MDLLILKSPVTFSFARPMRATILMLIIITLGTGRGTASHFRDTLSGHDVFASDSVLELELHLDLDSLLADLGEDPSYHEAIIVFRGPGDQHRTEMNIKVRARGSFRKQPENCDFPPLKLKFDKAVREGSIFENLKDLKLVTHCQTSMDEFEQYVLQEYLIYKSYNLFTEFSFRVRLARITYVDLPSCLDSITRFAFLLEDEEDMAERNDAVLLELESVLSEKLDLEQTALMAMFNYMIKNTDYSVPIVHNIELVSPDHFKPPIPVPYDFDWSGLINIPYDSPFTESKTRYEERKYKGPCLKRKKLEQVFSIMRTKQNDLYQLYMDFPYLDKELRARSLQEMHMFYIIIRNRELVREEFIKDCKD